MLTIPQIMPMAGCSQELLYLLCQIIDQVYEPNHAEYRSPAHLARLRSIEVRLQNLEQRPSAVYTLEAADVQGTTPHELTATLFQLAAITYLLRVARGLDRNSPLVVDTLDRAFDTISLLNQVGLCERPWPLFVIGLEAYTENQRYAVSTIIDKALKWQPLGPMALVKRMIQDSWVSQDLRGNAPSCQLNVYENIISKSRVPPCFV